MMRSKIQAKWMAIALLSIATIVNAESGGPLHVASPDWRDQIIYFVMTDRFNDGEPTNNNQGVGEYNPALNSHYSGGDLPGITQKINYIKQLGATAVWITPPVANQWWSVTSQYSGYHGYWAENFKAVDAHYGTLADLQQLSRRLHGQGMYLVQDIVLNHMGNYFKYPAGQPIAQKLAAGYQPEAASAQGRAPSQAPFHLNDARKAAHAKAAIYHWTADITDYTDPAQVLSGQMAGLDDLNTENPAVRQALRESYGYWIREAGVDAFRVDTAFYVPPALFRDFLYANDTDHPGMVQVAKATGREQFHVFGEGFAIDKPFEDSQSRRIERYVRDADGQALMPAMLNFPLYGAGVDVFAKGHATREMRHRIESMLKVHERPHLMPSFVDNHDVDRFLAVGSTAALQQNLLLIMTLPGIPVIYYGTEQGFSEQRGAMFKAGFGSGGRDRFDVDAPLFRTIQAMSALRKTHRLFSRGLPTVLKDNAAGAGVLAYRMAYEGQQALVLFNTADTATLMDNLPTGLPAGQRWRRQFSLNEFAETLIADSQGRLTAVLPARSGIVLMPEPGPAHAMPKAAQLQINPPTKSVSGERLLLSGRNSNATPFLLIRDGQMNSAQEVSPARDGRWQASMALDDLIDESIEHSVLAWQPSTATASAPQAFQVRRDWQPVLTVNDPHGDDNGRSGQLRYPADASWGVHRQGDIETVQIWRAGNNLRLDVRFTSISRFWNPPNGFDHMALTAFMQMPGRDDGKAVMPQQNGELPSGMRWHYRLRTHGWSNVWFTANGANAEHEGQVHSPGARLEADQAKRTLRITIPAAALGNPATLSSIKLILNTWDFDGGYRALSPTGGNMVFGGGGAGDTKVLDETAIMLIP